MMVFKFLRSNCDKYDLLLAQLIFEAARMSHYSGLKSICTSLETLLVLILISVSLTVVAKTPSTHILYR